MLKWAIRFFLLGVAIATFLSLIFMLDYKNYVNLGIQGNSAWGHVYLWLWPSSLMLIGVGEAPDSTWLTISINYMIAILVNGFVYAILGICVGVVVRWLPDFPASRQ